MTGARLYSRVLAIPRPPDTRVPDACAQMTALTVALSLAGFIVVACMRVSDPLLPVVAAEFGVSVGQAGVIGTAYAVAYGLFLLAYGPLGDRYGKLRIIAFTLSAAAIWPLRLGCCAQLKALSRWAWASTRGVSAKGNPSGDARGRIASTRPASSSSCTGTKPSASPQGRSR